VPLSRFDKMVGELNALQFSAFIWCL